MDRVTFIPVYEASVTALLTDQYVKIRAHPLSKHTDKPMRGAIESGTHPRCVSPAVFTYLRQSGPLIPQNTQLSHQPPVFFL